MESSEHHDEEIAKCLVDLHGTCLVMPFHRQGLPYLSFAVIAILQVSYLLKRMASREINAPNPPYAITEWHLLVGRFGILFFTIETALDHVRLFLGSFDQSWPYYIREAESASVANELWAKHGYRDTGMQTFLWWYCCFLQMILVPLTLYSVTFIYYKARRRTDDPLDAYKWFLKCSGAVVLIAVPSLVGFILGPLQGPLQVISVTGLWSMATCVQHNWFMQQFGVFVWQASLVGLGVALLTVEGSEKRLGNGLYLCVNIVALIGCFFVPLLVTDDTSWWPAVERLLQQAAIASQLWADSTHNHDDYGRLADDEYLPAHRHDQLSLRQPLLAQEVEEEQVAFAVADQEEENEDEGPEDASEQDVLDTSSSEHEDEQNEQDESDREEDDLTV